MFTFISAAMLVAPAAPIASQTAQIVAESGQPGLPYATVADRMLAAPAVVDATVRSASRLKPAETPGLAAGQARFYVVADVTALIRGAAGFPARVSYLVDVPLDSRGRVPRLRKQRVILFARPVAARPGEIQLVTPDAQQPWTPGLDTLVRRIAQELVAADAPPAITGVGNAFHVPGTLPGEGETQVFLTTPDARPVSISVLRRPGEQPRWAVALSEIVDEAAAPPPRDTLLWYRLACGLPPALPDRSLAALEPRDAEVAREDYRFVLAQLGPCGR
ncbi:hypothetical protein SAMN06297144_3053 [Sphingomonas guangdongensis]|uniref:Uncharacterized protein n=2 Tax=Sphingomonas guangdongensis TaxID=1141890 RepID=A0A285R1C7_9SPHN|nr:hypothetical protein SAMN06297144_3053 [Sphingomonas guangdongensis]